MYRRTRELLTEEQREQLTKISPTLDEWELGAYYTLTEQDRALIRRRRRDENRIGFAIQLCVLRHTGWPLSEINEVPNRVLHYIATKSMWIRTHSSVTLSGRQPGGNICGKSGKNTDTVHSRSGSIGN